MRRTLFAVLNTGRRMMWLLLGLPVILVLVSPIAVLLFVVFAAGVGGLRLDVGVGTVEIILVALGVTVAMSALCFNYSRASPVGDDGHRVGHQVGRLLLFAAVLLVTAGTADLLVLHPVVPVDAPVNTPLTAGVSGFILASARRISYAGAVALSGVAVLRLYAHGLGWYLRTVAASSNRSART